MEVGSKAVSLEELLKRKLTEDWGYRILLPEEVGLKEELGEDDIVLKDADNLILVSLIQIDLSGSLSPKVRKRVRGEIGRLARLSAYFNKAYIALPEEVLKLHKNKIIDVELLREAGIGLLSINLLKGEVRQLLPPKPRSSSRAERVDVTPLLKEMESKIRKLELLYDRLENELNEIKKEIDNLKVRIEITNTSRSKEEEIPKAEEESGREVKIEDLELPSFMRDNPWLEVLRRRGRE
ncbi:MAG: hypothetical protein B6U69_03170 [Thermofilum sp. ex4484_15]|nr:MAG: hypothetical protein B6U69_03170 [Thermofilum sp. ex4484_15]